jgi:anti-sigma factor RsiW
MSEEAYLRLHRFCRGTIGAKERLEVEREILADPEALVAFLDLKREIEGAAAVPRAPSPELWLRLRDKARLRERRWLPLSLGLAATAASLAIALGLATHRLLPGARAPAQHQLLFDSSRELPASSGVL